MVIVNDPEDVLLGLGVSKERTFPVVEIFGPTIQGEGPEVGTRCAFIRFGGCDYRCVWCDTKEAVLPVHVRQARRLTAEEILAEVEALDANVPLVLLSGGNPGLLDLEDIVIGLHRQGMRVSIETQASVWKAWMRYLDHIVASPKPPSAGYGGSKTWSEISAFVDQWDNVLPHPPLTFKIPCFDLADVTFAGEVAGAFPGIPMFLSVVTRSLGLDGTFAGGVMDTERDLLDRYEQIIEYAHHNHALKEARIIPQLHYLVWGAEKGR